MQPLLYRVFFAPLTLFFALMVLFCAQVQADDLYSVRGVQVDVSAASALDARKLAFKQAKRAAFDMVMTRIEPDAAKRAELSVPDDSAIASMVHDFEIVSEKMTSKRYAGVVDVTFTPASFKRALSVQAEKPQEITTKTVDENGVEVLNASTKPGLGVRDDYIYSPKRVVQNQAPQPVLVLPWYGVTGVQTLWGQGNPWRAAWEESAGLNRDTSMLVLLPVGDVDDVRVYAPAQPLSNQGNIDALLKRYNTSNAVLALAEPQQAGGLVVSLYRYVGGAAVPMGRFGVPVSSPDIMAEAVAKTVAALRGLPLLTAEEAPQVTPVSTSISTNILKSMVRFTGLQQWVSMRQALLNVPGVGGLTVQAISPSQATIEFSYNGNQADLSGVLAKGGLQLTALPPGTSPVPYLISAGGV